MENYFKVHNDTYPLSEEGVKQAIIDYNDIDELFDAYINDNNDSFEVCGYNYDASEAFKSCSEYDYDAEKEEWLKSKATEIFGEIENLSIGATYIDDETNDTYAICDANGNTETVPFTQVVVPDNAEVCIVDNGLSIEWKTDAQHVQVLVPKAIAKQMANALMS